MGIQQNPGFGIIPRPDNTETFGELENLHPKKKPLEEPERILLFGFSLDLFFLGCLQAGFEFLDPSGNSSGWKEQGWISRCLNKFGISSDGSTGMGAGIKLGIVGRNVEMWQQIPQDTGILFFFFFQESWDYLGGKGPLGGSGTVQDLDIQSGRIWEFRHPEWENSGIWAPRVGKFGIQVSRVGQFGNLGIWSWKIQESGHPACHNSGIQASRVGKSMNSRFSKGTEPTENSTFPFHLPALLPRFLLCLHHPKCAFPRIPG